MLNRIFALFLMLCLLAQPAIVRAADLAGAFNNLVGSGATASISAPGRFNSGARNVFVAGGADIRFPRTSVSLFSVTGPSFSAGCGGISLHFGGFSFISGEQIEQLIKNIAQGAVGFVVSLALKTLCPQCEAVIQAMQRLAQAASKAAIDSCGASENLANTLMDSFGAGPGSASTRQGTCSVKAAGDGDSSDFLSSMNSLCASAIGSINKLTERINGLSQVKDANGKETAASASEALDQAIGNRTWLVLSEVFANDSSLDTRKNKLFLMNLVGTEIAHPDARCTTTAVDIVSGAITEGAIDSTKVSQTTTVEQNATTWTCAPTITPQEAMALFMCGMPDSSTATASRAVLAYCNSWFTTQAADAATNVSGANRAYNVKSKMVWDCLDGYGRMQCVKMGPQSLANSSFVNGAGFVFQVNQLLRAGAKKIRNGEPFTDDEGKKIIGLIQAAPYPLYQAINAAAVYPVAADDLLDTMSLLVSELMAYQYFDDYLQTWNKGNPLGTVIGKQHFDRIYDGMAQIKAMNVERRALIAQNISIQEALSEQIRSINVAIQKQVLSADMLNQNKFATGTTANSQSINGDPGPSN